MQPTLNDGDLLLVRVNSEPEPSSLVVVRLPERPGRDTDGWWVERDNPREGVDSWQVGAIAPSDVVATVVARIWPLRRIGAPPTL